MVRTFAVLYNSSIIFQDPLMTALNLLSSQSREVSLVFSMQLLTTVCVCVWFLCIDLIVSGFMSDHFFNHS